MGALTALKDLAQRVEVPAAGFVPKAATTPKLGLDTQFMEGINEAYHTGITVPTQVRRSATAGDWLQLVYTPTFDAWWEVDLNIGIISADTATGWGYLYTHLDCTPAPITGPDARKTSIRSGRSDIIRYSPRSLTGLWALEANTTYTAKVTLDPATLSWSYHQGAAHLLMFGRGWAR